MLCSFENGKETWGSIKLVLCLTEALLGSDLIRCKSCLKATCFSRMRSVKADNDHSYSNFPSLVSNIISIV